MPGRGAQPVGAHLKIMNKDAPSARPEHIRWEAQ